MIETKVVSVGFYNAHSDQRRPIKFNGSEILKTGNWTSDETHANNKRYHTWTLYEVWNGFRVLDEYCTVFESESSHTGLSAVLTPIGVAKHYPVLANFAIDKGLWAFSDLVERASDGEENGKPAPVDYKYDQKNFSEDK